MSRNIISFGDEYRHGDPADSPFALPAKPICAHFRPHKIGDAKPRTLLAGGLRMLYREQIEKRLPEINAPAAEEFDGLIGYDPVRASLVCTDSKAQWEFWVRAYSCGTIYWSLLWQHLLYDATRQAIMLTLADREYIDRRCAERLSTYMRRCSRYEHSLEDFL